MSHDLQKELVLPGRYIVYARGRWRTELIEHSHAANTRLLLSVEARHELNGLIREYQQSGRALKVDATGALPPLYRLVSWSADSCGPISIKTEVTDYAEYLLTNVRHPERRAAMLGQADPVGVCAATITRDRKLVVGRRSSAVLDKPESWHVVPAGHPHPPRSLREGLVSELLDEAGIESARVSLAACTGLLRAARTGKPEVTFLLEVDATLSEIIHSRSVESWEFERYDALPWEPERVEGWLTSEEDSITDAGHGCILLAGAAEFGETWLARVIERLRDNMASE